MTQRLVVVEGALALPTPPKTGGLPPPFGRLWQDDFGTGEAKPSPRHAQSREPQRPARADRSTAAPIPKHILFYKAPAQRRADTRSIDAALEEARRYLAMGVHRPQSTRSDYILGATIVAGCSLVLAWLLVSCSMREANKANEIAARTVVVSNTRALVGPAHPAIPAQKAPAPLAASTNVSRQVTPSPRSLSRERAAVHPHDYFAARQSQSMRPARSIVGKPQHVSELRAMQRVATSHAMRPLARPLASVQPEWSTRQTRNSDAAEQAALMNWATQQRHIAQTVRLGTLPDENWNTRMVQRRITDNPDAFQAGHAQK